MKRRWFQIHLSTAIVLMVVAAILLWANLHWWSSGERLMVDEDSGETIIRRLGSQGWPFWHLEVREAFTLQATPFIAANVMICGGILAIVGILCELAIPNREADKLGSDAD